MLHYDFVNSKVCDAICNLFDTYCISEHDIAAVAKMIHTITADYYNDAALQKKGNNDNIVTYDNMYDDDDDIYDDVDETNYNPFIGQEDYEVDNYGD